jgi:hypothetical protein
MRKLSETLILGTPGIDVVWDAIFSLCYISGYAAGKNSLGLGCENWICVRPQSPNERVQRVLIQ